MQENHVGALRFAHVFHEILRAIAIFSFLFIFTRFTLATNDDGLVVTRILRYSDVGLHARLRSAAIKLHCSRNVRTRASKFDDKGWMLRLDKSIIRYTQYTANEHVPCINAIRKQSNLT